MTMSPEEICRHYTQAANQKKDIQVLADLNGTDSASIRAVLIDGGLLPPDKARRKRKQTPEALVELAEEIAKALDEGLDDKTVAERVGCCELTVKNHRKQRKRPVAPENKPVAQESEPVAQESEPVMGLYARIEQILAALPTDANKESRYIAMDLCTALLWAELERRLGVRENDYA